MKVYARGAGGDMLYTDEPNLNDGVTVKRSDQLACPRCGSIGFCLPLSDELDRYSLQCLKCGAVVMYTTLVPTPTPEPVNQRAESEDQE